MRGTIIKRGSRYSVVVDVGRDPRSGKRIRKWHSGYRTRRAAEEARIEILSTMQRGSYVQPTKMAFSVFLIEQWLLAIVHTVKPATLQSYRHNVEAHVVPRLGHVQLQALNPAQLNMFYAELLADGRVDGRGGLSPKTVRYIHTIIHRALRDAVRWNLVPRNVSDAADPPAISRSSTHRTWSADEVRTFLAGVPDDHLRGAWILAATTGMRRGEVLGLRRRDVDLENATLSVRHTLISVAYEVLESTPKTARGARLVELDSFTVRTLRKHLVRQKEQDLHLGCPSEGDVLMFRDPTGSPIHPDRFSKLFKKHSAKMHLPAISLHGLRHTHATLALQAGAHPKVVSERLGHANVSITLDTYSHVLPSMQREIAQELGELILG